MSLVSLALQVDSLPIESLEKHALSIKEHLLIWETFISISHLLPLLQTRMSCSHSVKIELITYKENFIQICIFLPSL